ncbi:MAG: glutathione transport system permease protein [Actinomycetota bacterium]|nr:glutathione transport system permease protein [Actinomycetota bacterium]
MAVFVIRRLLASVLTLVVSSFLVFVLVANSGDPLSDLRTDTSVGREQKIAHRIEVLNLDQPVPRRYLTWAGGVTRCVVPGQGCDLGRNIRDQEVSVLLTQAAGSTLRLVSAALVLAVLLGVSVGVISSLRQYSGFDYTITFAAFLFFSLPVFWVAVLLKQYLAIEANNWYQDPRVGPFPALVLAVLSGLTWGAIAGGTARRRWIVRGASAAATFGLLSYLSAINWFRYPALGPGLIIVFSLGAATGIAFLAEGLRRRQVLHSCLATAAVGSLGSFVVTPWLLDPKWASWTNLLLLLVLSLLLASGIGYALGGVDKGEAVRASLVTAVVTGFFIVLDIVLRTLPGYADLVGGRVFATIGARTPNFEGTFWEQQLDTFTHLLLPTLSILLISFATYSRYSRSTMLEVMNQDYIRTARAKGLTERAVVLRHAFRNALIPVTTLAALDFGALISGAVITEYVFGWQGMGNLFFSGLIQVDPNPVMAFYLVTALSVAAFNLLADIAYAYLDPRIRLS